MSNVNADSEAPPAALARPAFIHGNDAAAVERNAEHGGRGPIAFRRLASRDVFDSPIDFVDFTIIPQGSTIGRHEHIATEELYFIVAGTPLVIVDGEASRLKAGDVTIVRSSQSHELINDSGEPVKIFVIQVRA